MSSEGLLPPSNSERYVSPSAVDTPPSKGELPSYECVMPPSCRGITHSHYIFTQAALHIVPPSEGILLLLKATRSVYI